MNLQDAFNNRKTDNGDLSFFSSNNPYIDIVFHLSVLRQKTEHLYRYISLAKIFDKEYYNENAKYFAMLIRDPRLGFGERDLGRIFFEELQLTPEDILYSGRADDIFHLGYNASKKERNISDYWQFLFDCLNGNKSISPIILQNIKKWMPRERGNNAKKIRLFRKLFNLSPKAYRKLISLNTTTEAILSRGDKVKNYSTVPSLSFLKHFGTFIKYDKHNFENFLIEASQGKVKINTSTSTPYDIYLARETNKINDQEANTLFNNLEKVNLPKILCIVDQSGSMWGFHDAYLKARAIASYVSMNTSYLKNHIIPFSDEAQLLYLGESIEEHIKVYSSFDEASNTNFGNVMQILSKVDENLPDYLLVLSDMQFDEGSATKKDETMEIIKKYNPNLKIIWWNLDNKSIQVPELDNYGNLFLSGYNPMLLKFLEFGFDGYTLIKSLIEKYKESYLKQTPYIK